jgi:hypothetical protein
MLEQTRPRCASSRLETCTSPILACRTISICIISRQLDNLNVSGYSVMPIVEGRGMSNEWTSEGQVSNATNMVLLLCIVDP